MDPWMPPPLVLCAWSGKPPASASPQTTVRQANRVAKHCARRRRESPSGKDPTVVLRYIVLLHLILRWKALGLDSGYFRLKHPPKNLAPVTRKLKIPMSRNAKKVFVYRRDCQ
jgi:hypothetical protein